MQSPAGAGVNWFYVREGRRIGPFDRAPLIAQLLTLDAPEAVLVWRTGLAAWTKAGLLDELRGELPPPVPRSLLGPDGPASDPVASEGPTEEVLPPLPSEGAASDGDFASDLGQDSEPSEEEDAAGPGENDANGRQRRRRRQRPSRPSRMPSYLLPIVLLFVAVMLGLWFLLRRMNEVPPGQILQQGMLTPNPGPEVRSLEPTGSLPGATPA